MSAVLLPAPVQAFAPEFAGRFGRILVLLAKLVAASFLRNPRLALLIVPLWTRLNRAARRFDRLMAHVAAGRLPRPRKPGRSGPHPSGPALPTSRAWVVHEFGSEAACYGSQMQALLAEPAAVELLRHVPTANRIVNPILRMLGIGPYAPRPRRTRATPQVPTATRRRRPPLLRLPLAPAAQATRKPGLTRRALSRDARRV